MGMLCSWTREPKLFTALSPLNRYENPLSREGRRKNLLFIFFCCQGVRWCLDHYVMTSILAVLVVVVVFRGWLASLSLSFSLSRFERRLSFLDGIRRIIFAKAQRTPPEASLWVFPSYQYQSASYLQEARSSLLVMCAVLWRGYFRFLDFLSLYRWLHLSIT